LEVSVQNFTQLSGRDDFMPVYLRLRDRTDNKRAQNFVQISEEVLRRPWQWLDWRECEPYTGVWMECPFSPKLKQASHAKNKVKSMLIIFFYIKGYYSQRVLPGRPNSQFRILLWRITATAKKCAKTSPWTLVTKELAVASRQRTALHFLFAREFLTINNMAVIHHSPYLPLFNFKQLRWSTQNRRLCWTPSQNMTSRMHLKGQKCWDYFESNGGQ
jgi:hypothetical protein